MKILITGGSGLLGQYLNYFLSSRVEILSIYNSNIGNCGNFNAAKGNLLDKKFMHNIFEAFHPQVVIHTAAITNPVLTKPFTEQDYYSTNIEATKLIAVLCDQFDSKLIYTSTDLVYAGNIGQMRNESDLLNPISIYAQTKLIGENKIKESFENYIILRTALLFGFGLNQSKCFFDKMFESLSRNNSINLFTDQFRTPLSLIEAARVIAEIISLDLKSEIINLAGSERVSRFKLGELLCNITGFNKKNLIRISMEEVKGYPQVRDVSLCTKKLKTLGIKLKSLEENLDEILKLRLTINN